MSVKVKMLVVGTFVLIPIQFADPRRLVEAWMILVLLVVVITVKRNWPLERCIALVSFAGVGGGKTALATITSPVIPAPAWPGTVHS